MSTPIDTNALRKAIRNFSFYSSPSSANYSDPCTVGDIHKVINKVSELAETFVAEIEKSQ